jgi:hypothetical protein
LSSSSTSSSKGIASWLRAAKLGHKTRDRIILFIHIAAAIRIADNVSTDLSNASFGDIASVVGPSNPGNPWAIINRHRSILRKPQ